MLHQAAIKLQLILGFGDVLRYDGRLRRLEAGSLMLKSLVDSIGPQTQKPKP